MDDSTLLSLLFFVVAPVCVLVGVVVVAHYPDRWFSVPLARALFLIWAGFMLWLVWTAYNGASDSPSLNWTCAVLGLGGATLFGGTALFGSSKTVLWVVGEFVEHLRRGS
jgi:hypothetical protein